MTRRLLIEGDDPRGLVPDGVASRRASETRAVGGGLAAAPVPRPLSGRPGAPSEESASPQTEFITLPAELSLEVVVASEMLAEAHRVMLSMDPRSSIETEASRAMARTLASVPAAGRDDVQLAWLETAAETAAEARKRASRAIAAVEAWYTSGAIRRV